MALKNLTLHPEPVPPTTPNLQRLVSATNLNIHDELVDNYNAALQLRDSLAFRDDIPPNQVAQVMNSMTAILTQLTKLQTDLYSAQRIKDIELILIDTLKSMPKPMQDHFFAEYSKKIPPA